MVSPTEHECCLYDGRCKMLKTMDGRYLTRSIWLIDGDKYIDLSKYGASDMNLPSYYIDRYTRDPATNAWVKQHDGKLTILGRRHNNNMTALTREEIECWVEMNTLKCIPKHCAMLSSFIHAVKRYEAKKRWGVIKALMYINKHYMDTMERSYSPDGVGYKRTRDHWSQNVTEY